MDGASAKPEPARDPLDLMDPNLDPATRFRILNRTKPMVDGALTVPFVFLFQPLNVAAINIRVGTPIGKATGRSTLLEILANPYDGWRALWKGSTPAVLTVILGAASRAWTGHNIANDIISAGESGDQKAMEAALHRSEVTPEIAKVATSLALQPLNVIQTRLAVDFSSKNRNFTGVIDCIRKTKRIDGLATFWRGLLPAMYGYLLGSIASGGIISGAVALVAPSKPSPDKVTSVLPLFVPASFILSSAIMHPFLIVASQRQVSSIFLPNHMRPKMLGKEDPQGFGTTWELLRMNVARHGIRRGLFRGFGVTLAHSMLTQPVLWLTLWKQPMVPDMTPGGVPAPT